jgi:hypothetical protein
MNLDIALLVAGCSLKPDSLLTKYNYVSHSFDNPVIRKIDYYFCRNETLHLWHADWARFYFTRHLVIPVTGSDILNRNKTHIPYSSPTHHTLDKLLLSLPFRNTFKTCYPQTNTRSKICTPDMRAQSRNIKHITRITANPRMFIVNTLPQK